MAGAVVAAEEAALASSSKQGGAPQWARKLRQGSARMAG